MRSIFPTLLLVFAGTLFAAQGAVAQTAEAKTFGDWGYKCEPAPDGNGEFCYVFQNVTKKEGGQLVLGARVATRPDKPDPLLVLTVPLGTLLPPGAALVMDGAEPVKLPFFLCSGDGCTTVATALPADMVTAMKKGETAVVRIAAPNKQVVGLPLSLKGFTKAMGTLK